MSKYEIPKRDSENDLATAAQIVAWTSPNEWSSHSTYQVVFLPCLMFSRIEPLGLVGVISN